LQQKRSHLKRDKLLITDGKSPDLLSFSAAAAAAAISALFQKSQSTATAATSAICWTNMNINRRASFSFYQPLFASLFCGSTRFYNNNNKKLNVKPHI